MANVENLLREIHNLGGSLRVEEEQLKCTAPPGALTPELARRISENKVSIVEYLTQVIDQRPPITAMSSAERAEAPLTFQQLRLWFMDKYDSASGAYNMPVVLRLSRAPDSKALEEALREVVARHETLNTVFASAMGKPTTRALITEFVLATTDLSSIEHAQAKNAIEAAIMDEWLVPFDLEAGPLIRARLLTTGSHLAGTECLLLLTMHHIIGDEWSYAILLNDVTAAYLQKTNIGDQVTLPPLELQYADYAHWQATLPSFPGFKKSITYWRSRLAGVPATSQLTLNRTRSGQRSSRGDSITTPVDPKLRQRINAQAQRLGVTPFVWLLGSLAVLLYKHSGQRDLCIGTPVASRPDARLERLIGLFASTLPIRTQVQPEQSFREYLEALSEAVAGDFANQDVPFEKIVDELKVPRTTSYSPLFQVLFAFQNVPSDLALLEVFGGEIQARKSRFSRYDLSLTLRERPGEWQIHWEYSTDVFEEADVRLISERFERLNEQLAGNPHSLIHALTLINTESEKQALLSCNPPATTYPSAQTALAMFEAQVQSSPAQIALVAGHLSISYAELDARAEAIASQLESVGVGVGDCVGLHMARGADLVAGMLGIFKLGAHYLPLDPAYPHQRLQYMVEDAAPKAILQTPGVSEVPVACPRVHPNARRVQADGRRRALGGTEAYLIYTSGSTGRPKGVLVSQPSLTNFLHAMQSLLKVSATDRWLAVTSVSFDIAALEVFLPLACGATVVLAAEEESADPARLAHLMQRELVSCLQTTPSRWRAVLNHLAGMDNPPALRLGLCGGEQWDERLNGSFRTFVRETWNVYGPTETTIWSSAEKFDGEHTPSIGQPIANTQLYVLDEGRQLLPVGVPGELYIGGAGVALGYHNLPALTAERFVESPLVAGKGRLYRTGDLARRRSDHSLEFLGRVDSQVKVRGFRIELGEIESALTESPLVAKAIALVRRDPSSGDRIEAFVEMSSTGEEKYSESDHDFVTRIRDSLRSSLPQYMVPNAFHVIRDWPMTPNGKIDRIDLALGPFVSSAAVEYRAPRSDVERRLVALWERLLDTQNIGVTDNFFDRGGHSLLAIELIAQIANEFGSSIPLTQFFEGATIQHLAEALHNQDVSTSRSHLTKAPVLTHYPTTPGQQRVWLYQAINPESTAYHISATLELQGLQRVEEARLLDICRVLSSRHAALRAVFKMLDGELVQVLRESRDLDVRLLTAETDALAAQKIEEFLSWPFNLEKGPLFRVLITYIPKSGRQRLTWAVHHLICDGVSLETLAREGRELLSHADKNEADLGSRPVVDFIDFCWWSAQRKSLDAERAYWREQLKNPPQRLALPYDYGLAARANLASGAFSAEVPGPLLQRLKSLAKTEGVTVFMSMLASFGTLLRNLSGQERFLIGIPVAGRSQPRLRRVVGFFVNTVAIEFDFRRNTTFRALLDDVRRQVLGALKHQSYSFDQVVEDLGLPNEPNTFPVTPVLFNLLSLNEAQAELVNFTPGHRKIRQQAKLDQDWYVFLHDETAHIDCHYKSGLFTPSTIEYMVEEFFRILESGTSQLDAPIEALVSAQRVTHELVTANFEPGPSLEPPIEAFRRIARTTPSAIALRDGETAVSYKQLEEKVLRLSVACKEAGVSSEDRIAVLTGHNLFMITALLAALNIGVPYVPIDPRYPVERKRALILDSGASILLTERSLQELVDEIGTALPTLHVDAALESEAQAYEDTVVVDILDRWAYILYTSGSTGKPKGVIQSQRNLAYFVKQYVKTFGLTSNDNSCLFASFTFDAAALDILSALTTGACLTLMRLHDASPREVVQTVERNKITLLHLTPTSFRYLFSGHADEHHAQLKTVRGYVLGGELVTRQDMDIYDSLGTSQAFLANLYGASECSLASAKVFQGAEGWTEPPSVGSAVSGVIAQVISEGKFVGPYVEGEIVLGGEYLAIGYWNRPELDASFYHDAHGQRWYRTGDLGRILPNNEIYPSGRALNHVKIAGVLVNPLEVEQVARLSQTIQESACVVIEASGQSHLALACTPNTPTLEPDIRAFIARHLPSAMCPSRIIFFDSLPRTTSGKLDRAETRLQVLAVVGSASSAPPSEPLSEVADRVCRIVQEVTMAPSVSIRDNLLSIGANSLQAMQVISRLNREFDVELPLREVLVKPTIQFLVERIEGHRLARQLMVKKQEDGVYETLEF